MRSVMPRRVRQLAGAALVAVAALLWPGEVSAQFGRNKVQYGKFDFQVLKTEHFDIYYYPEEQNAARLVGRMAERWNARLSRLLNHTLTGRQILILYASHPDFEQTNVIEGEIGEATGGVTEGLRRRIIMPLGATLADTDHVLGHELVHAFQYDMLDPRMASTMPLWFIEGMAEYLSVGPRDAQTAMWLRDAAIENRLPKLTDLDDPRYFPYRFGHALWAYIGGRWGDATIARIMKALSPDGTLTVPEGVDPTLAEQAASRNRTDAISIIEAATGRNREDLASQWHAAIRETYAVSAAPTAEKEPTGIVIGERERGDLNVGPALSPDGTKVAFLSARSRISIDLYVADARTGKVLRKLIDTSADPHFESLQFLASAGSWDPTSRLLAVGTIRGGKPVLAIIDADRGRIEQEIRHEESGEIFQPTWSPDGQSIAFAAQTGGVTDLFVYDLKARTFRRLTNDAFADLMPAWSPDGRRIAFVTDRFASAIETLAFRGHGLATMSVEGGDITAVRTGLEGDAINPQWTGDSRSLFFIADAGGRPNVWRVDAAGGTAERMTDEITGVTGITPMSPALSVATKTNAAAVSVFRDAGHEIRLLPALTPAPASTRARVDDYSALPPSSRTSQVVNELANTTQDLPAASAFKEDPYSSKLSLVGVGQSVGVSSNSMFGTYVGGGIALQFSDVLGNHLLGTGVSINGGAKDVSASVSYLNRTSRWNWGVFGERVPLLSGTVNQGFTTVDGQTVFVERQDLFRETYMQAGAMVYYPFSRSTRLEFSGAGRRISFDREVRDSYFDPNTFVFLGEEVTKLPSLDALNLADVGAALVRDTSLFGATSPIRGQRARLEVSPTFGDLRMTNVSIDFRQYAMPKQPVTFAMRFLHAGRYGESAEDERLTPLFLGYPTLVRGYDVNSFRASECSITPDGSCPEFDRLLGSRVAVFNGEIRIPAGGLFTGRLDYGPVPVELIAFFDAGVAWNRGQRPSFANGTRDWVTSAGFGARVNLLGFAIGEFNIARPLNRAGRGWMFVFNLRPGF